jgi:hypothetical protein
VADDLGAVGADALDSLLLDCKSHVC